MEEMWTRIPQGEGRVTVSDVPNLVALAPPRPALTGGRSGLLLNLAHFVEQRKEREVGVREEGGSAP